MFKFFLLFFCPCLCHAQSATSIYYDREALHIRNAASTERLIFNDSASFNYGYREKDDPFSGELLLGVQMRHHSGFYDKSAGVWYSYVNFPDKSPVMIAMAAETNTWKLTGKEKLICGYQCYQAVKKPNPGSRTVVWYCPELGETSMYPFFDGLPGIPLEITDSRGAYHLKAREVSKGAYRLQRADARVVSSADYKKQREEGKRLAQQNLSQ